MPPCAAKSFHLYPLYPFNPISYALNKEDSCFRRYLKNAEPCDDRRRSGGHQGQVARPI